jgi:hypothetical protein
MDTGRDDRAHAEHGDNGENGGLDLEAQVAELTGRLHYLRTEFHESLLELTEGLNAVASICRTMARSCSHMAGVMDVD